MTGRVVLHTGRLTLREFVEADAAAFLALGTDPEVARYVHDKGYRDVEEARLGLLAGPLADYRLHGFGRWACVLKSTGEVIGFSGLKRRPELTDVDIGYRFLPAHWGQGLATEAGRAVVAYGFTRLGLSRLVGLVDPGNAASARVLLKLGFVREGCADCLGIRADRYVIGRPPDGPPVECNGGDGR